MSKSINFEFSIRFAQNESIRAFISMLIGKMPSSSYIIWFGVDLISFKICFKNLS